MPQTTHIARHFTGSETVKDIVIGMSDRWTVPFALAAGLSGAINTTGIIVTAGIAEIAAGSIAMGLGGYMAAKSDAEHYVSEWAREELEVNEKRDIEAAEVAEVFHAYGLTAEESRPVVDALRKHPQAWVDFMMRFDSALRNLIRNERLSAQERLRELISGAASSRSARTLSSRASTALIVSVIITLTALAVFGYVKGRFTGAPPLRSAIQTVVIGGLSAAVAFMIARVIS